MVDVVNNFGGQELTANLAFHNKSMDSKPTRFIFLPNFKMWVSPTKKYRSTIEFRKIGPTLNQILYFFGQRRGLLCCSNFLKIFSSLFLSIMLFAKSKSQMHAPAFGKRAFQCRRFPSALWRSYWMQFHATRFLVKVLGTQPMTGNWTTTFLERTSRASVEFFTCPSQLIVMPTITPCLCEILATGIFTSNLSHGSILMSAAYGVKG